ncbi:hypothetical protein C8J56DRAFT_860833 [Mycena floridula]|nr:hypothetical protein C8J56DRAFT_860833 [Mycena floridula]
MSTSEIAARLKDEGNALFVNKDFVEANKKYSEAIDLQPSAVLYSNRAACRLNTKEYLGACDDSKMAIELDPTYARAHARLATAHDYMNEPWHSVSEWGSAVNALNKNNLTPTEIKQKAQYEASLAAAKKNLIKMETPRNVADFLPVIKEHDTMNAPWYQAHAIIPKLRAEGKLNSRSNFSFTVVSTYAPSQDFVSGIQTMRATRQVGIAWIGMTGAIASVSNAILRDERIFHITGQDPNWISMYNNQVMLEVTKTLAWIKAGAKTVIKEAQERLARGGWDSVRPALSTTVRCWILRGFLDSGLRQNYAGFVEFMNNAVEVITAGQEVWKDVPREQRGTIFDDSFLRGVLNLQLDAFTKAYRTKSSPDVKDLEIIKAKAETLIRLVEESPAPSFDSTREPGFINSFWHYPKGQAYSMIAFYHMQMSNLTEDKDEEQIHLGQSALGYLAASECYPLDDEQHAWFISRALQNAALAGPTPVKVFIEMFDKLHAAMPAFETLWKHSSMAIQGLCRDALIKLTMRMEPDLRQRLASGELKMDSLISSK